MKHIILKFFILLITCSPFYGHANYVCKKEEVLKSNKVINEIILDQTQRIKKVLAGKFEQGTNLSSFFGYDFKVEDTAMRIVQLEQLNKQNDGIALENQSTAKCLKELGLDKSYKKLSQASIELNTLKIELFKKNLITNDVLKKNIESQNSLPDLNAEINKENTDSQKLKKTLENDLIATDKKLSKIDNFRSQQIASYRNALTHFKIELIDKQVKNNKNLQERLEHLSSTSQIISDLSLKLEDANQDQVVEGFLKIENIWYEVTQENLFLLFKSDDTFDLPSIPKEIVLKAGEDNSTDISELKEKRQEAIELRLKTLKNLTEKKDKELILLNELILNINKLRSDYYKKLSTDFVIARMFSKQYFISLKNEIIASPYRGISFFYSKYLYINERISSGREGISELTIDILKILFILFCIFSLRMVLGKFYLYIDQQQEKLLRAYRKSDILKLFSSLWSRLKDNFSHLIWIFIIQILLSAQYFTDIKIVLETVQIILWAKILKSLVVLFLGSISRIDIKSFLTFKKKAIETSEHFTSIFLVYFLTMIFIEATIGKVYIYSIVNFWAITYSVYRLMSASSKWEEEFKLYLERRFSGIITEKIEQGLRFAPKKVKATLIFIAIIFLSIFDFIIRLTENLEISKKISANLFKKQIESVEAEDGADTKIPQSYKDEFSFNSITETDEYVIPDEKLEKQLTTEIEEWIDCKSDEHSLVVFGDKGIGKTTLLKHITQGVSEAHQEELDVIYVKMPSKILEKKRLEEFIANIFTFDKGDQEFSIYDIDKMLEKKTIVTIDEAQNIFLSQTGGFEAYYAFINIINLNTEKIFWVMSFNKYSWLYLDRAFGRSLFFRNIYELKGWSDSKIKELINKRHQKSSFKLSYDLLISATRSQDEIDRYASVESKFFKLLWELSRGNPRAALYLWLTSLSRKNRSTFNVNIPKGLELEGLERLPDDLMFVMAHVLKHENLSAKEIESSANLPKGIVRNAIKVALERKFLYRDENRRYMIDISSQYGLIRYLRLKNFIYGS